MSEIRDTTYLRDVSVSFTDLDGNQQQAELEVHLDPTANAPFAVDASFAETHDTVPSPYNPAVTLRLGEPS